MDSLPLPVYASKTWIFQINTEHQPNVKKIKENSWGISETTTTNMWVLT